MKPGKLKRFHRTQGHSFQIKRETLEIFKMNKKNVIARFLTLNPPAIFQLFTLFFARWLRDVSRDLLVPGLKLLKKTSSYANFLSVYQPKGKLKKKHLFCISINHGKKKE